MPLLDPSISLYLCTHYMRSKHKNNTGFFLRYLKIASRNLGRNSDTIQASIQFKKDLKSSISLLNDRYHCDFSYEKDLDNPLIYDTYKYLYDNFNPSLKKKLKKKQYGYYNIYKNKYIVPLFQPEVDFSKEHAWFLTDLPVAVLCINLIHSDENEDFIQLINLEIDLMRAAGFTLCLVFIFKPNCKLANELTLKTVKSHPFEEIHFFLATDEKDSDTDFDFSSNEKNLTSLFTNLLDIYENIRGYFYFYSQFFGDVTNSTFSEVFKKIKSKPRFYYYTFAKNPLFAINQGCMDVKNNYFEDEQEELFIDSFVYSKSGFNQDKIRILLSYVLLYNTEDDENDRTPFDKSDFNVCYISKSDFLKWKNKRILVWYQDLMNENHLVEKYINFEDIHFLKMDFYCKSAMYFCKASEETLAFVERLSNELLFKYATKISKNEFHRERFFSLFKEKKLKQIISYIAYAYENHYSNLSKLELFVIHENQLFTTIEACKFCLLNDNNKSKNKGFIYQLETGEGKSCIINLIAAVLGLCHKTVHITTSNIHLSNRDYYESYNFFRSLGLKTSILLHYNELPYINVHNIKSDVKVYDRKYYPSEFFHKKLFNNSSNMNFSVCGVNDNNEITKNKANIIFSTFINFECLYLRMMEISPSYINNYFSECSLLIDEADSILIDEISNGTILSRPMKTNCNEILKFVYQSRIQKKNVDEVFKQVKKQWPKCKDLEKEDIEEMFEEIDLINNDEFKNGKKYSIENLIIKEKKKNIVQKVKDKIEDIKNIVNNKKKEVEIKKFKQIIPFDYDNKGILEPNKEFSGFVQQFIAIKEILNNEKENQNMIIKDLSMNYLFVSHPIFVNLYHTVCGLTGTTGNKFDKQILKEHYNLSTMKIPKNVPNHRIEYPTLLCSDIKERNEKIVDEVLLFHQKNCPVLVIFQDLNEISEVFKMLVLKGIKYINIFDGKDENNKPDQIAGKKGEVSLGTNSCGRGTDIKNPNKPLHVIVTYFTSNTRVMQQAFGRTSRQGQDGSVRVICLKSQYFSPTSILDQNSIKNILDDYDFKNQAQIEFIENIRKKRKWIFDSNISSQEINKQFIEKMRDVRININRIKAVNFEYPICMSTETFLRIQSQKIFSLFNCPNCKFTWMLFQKYIREMILESWSLCINQSEKKYRLNKSNSIKYKDFLNSEIENLKKNLNIFLPDLKSMNDEDYEIVPTFMNIFNYVVQLYEKPVLVAFPDTFINCYKTAGKKQFCSFSIGFKPYSLIDKSGARINTLENSDQEQNYIYDPELKYMRKQPKGFRPIVISITEKIDVIFNLICKKLNEVIGSYLGLKFFLRRTLGGCEFGVCFDFELDNIDQNILNDFVCIVDKDPLFVFTINVKSMIPFLAGILIIGLVYMAKIAKNIFEWITTFPTKITTTLVKQTVKAVFDQFVVNSMNNQIDLFVDKLTKFLGNVLKKQINILHGFLPKIAYLFNLLMHIAITKDFSNSNDIINDLFQKKSSFKMHSNFCHKYLSNNPMGKHFLKIGFLVILCFASFMMNFHCKRKSLHYHTHKTAAQFDKNQDADDALKNNEKYVEKQTKDSFK